MLQYSRILILSPLEDEVSQWMNALPSQKVIPSNDPEKNIHASVFDRSDAKLYYQKVIHQPDTDFTFDIFGFAGDLIKYDFILEITLDLPGIIFLVDQRRPESFDASRDTLALLHSYELNVPIVIVDTAPTSDPTFMRTHLGMLDEEQFLNCDLEDLNSIKTVILALVRLIQKYAESQELLTALNQL